MTVIPIEIHALGIVTKGSGRLENERKSGDHDKRKDHSDKKKKHQNMTPPTPKKIRTHTVPPDDVENTIGRN